MNVNFQGLDELRLVKVDHIDDAGTLMVFTANYNGHSWQLALHDDSFMDVYCEALNLSEVFEVDTDGSLDVAVGLQDLYDMWVG